MQDHAKEVDGCIPDGLQGEEIVGLRGDTRANGGWLRGENGCAIGDCVREVLDDEPELGKCGCEGDGGAAGGAADLMIDFAAMISHEALELKIGDCCW